MCVVLVSGVPSAVTVICVCHRICGLCGGSVAVRTAGMRSLRCECACVNECIRIIPHGVECVRERLWTRDESLRHRGPRRTFAQTAMPQRRNPRPAPTPSWVIHASAGDRGIRASWFGRLEVVISAGYGGRCAAQIDSSSSGSFSAWWGTWQPISIHSSNAALRSSARPGLGFASASWGGGGSDCRRPHGHVWPAGEYGGVRCISARVGSREAPSVGAPPTDGEQDSLVARGVGGRAAALSFLLQYIKCR